MTTRMFDEAQALIEACQELRDRLNEAREELTDAQFDRQQDGPFGEIFCAAMDVEYMLEKCEDA